MIVGHTIPNLQKNMIKQFELFGEERFEVMGRCIFGLPNTYWNEVLDKVEGRKNADFDQALVLYVEKVTLTQYPQDAALR